MKIDLTVKQKPENDESGSLDTNDIIDIIQETARAFQRQREQREFVDMIFDVAKGKWQTYHDYLVHIGEEKRPPFILDEIIFDYIQSKYAYK